jgi:hypothetical protein
MDMDRFPNDLNPDPILVIADPNIMPNTIEITTKFLFIASPLARNTFESYSTELSDQMGVPLIRNEKKKGQQKNGCVGKPRPGHHHRGMALQYLFCHRVGGRREKGGAESIEVPLHPWVTLISRSDEGGLKDSH